MRLNCTVILHGCAQRVTNTGDKTLVINAALARYGVDRGALDRLILCEIICGHQVADAAKQKSRCRKDQKIEKEMVKSKKDMYNLTWIKLLGPQLERRQKKFADKDRKKAMKEGGPYFYEQDDDNVAIALQMDFPSKYEPHMLYSSEPPYYSKLSEADSESAFDHWMKDWKEFRTIADIAFNHLGHAHDDEHWCRVYGKGEDPDISTIIFCCDSSFTALPANPVFERLRDPEGNFCHGGTVTCCASPCVSVDRTRSERSMPLRQVIWMMMLTLLSSLIFTEFSGHSSQSGT